MSKVHGPFATKRERDAAIETLQARKGCSCEKCLAKPEDDRPLTAPLNMMRLRGRQGSYWIATNMAGIRHDKPV